jgi:hypothetical protein
MLVLMLTVRMTYSQGVFLTDVQRDSAYAKIQRGIIDAERVKLLDSALVYCDSIKNIKTLVIGIQEQQKDSLSLVITKQSSQIVLLNENVNLEVKRGRRRGFWGFIKGTVVGTLIVAVLAII